MRIDWAILGLVWLAFLAFGEWFFAHQLWTGLKTGKFTAQHGPIHRTRNPVMYWAGILMATLWVVLIPVLFISSVEIDITFTPTFS